MFGPRGVFHCYATDTVSTLPDDARFGKWGKQRCEDTGPLTKKRMETVDEEVLAATVKFIDKEQQGGKPWFVWFNTTRMHIHTHLKPESQGKTGLGIGPDGMVEHDGHIGQLLKKLDDLGVAENTIVIWTTDNGAEVFSWPDGGTTPFRGEKNSNWEGGYRVPLVVRWPGVIKPGTEINEIVSHEDWLPTLLAAAGQPNVKESALTGLTAGGVTYKVHLDGYNLLPYFKGETKEWPRKEFIYWTDDGDPAGLRFEQWKMAFLDQRTVGFNVWQDPLVVLRFPKLFNLRADPFERAEETQRLHGLPGQSRVPGRSGHWVHRQVDPELQGLPATPEARQLQPQPRDGEAEEAAAVGERRVRAHPSGRRWVPPPPVLFAPCFIARLTVPMSRRARRQKVRDTAPTPAAASAARWRNVTDLTQSRRCSSCPARSRSSTRRSGCGSSGASSASRCTPSRSRSAPSSQDSRWGARRWAGSPIASSAP